eukprot:4146768-Pleurochrysis_carterae.AAC.3
MRASTASRVQAKASGRTPPPIDSCADRVSGSHTEVAADAISFAVGRRPLAGSSTLMLPCAHLSTPSSNGTQGLAASAR